MKGHVETPVDVVDQMVELLFDGRQPVDGDRILYPGCGAKAPFVSAVSEYCEERGLTVPEGTAFETHPDRIEAARELHRDEPVEFRCEDFLQDRSNLEPVEYLVGNPPYVPIEDIESKEEYRERFKTAKERFDLYILFFEQGIHLLQEGGRLCFITPEKYEYTKSAQELRRALSSAHVERIEHHPENLFGTYRTYPSITIVENSPPGDTTVVRRDGTRDVVSLPRDGSSWAPVIRNVQGPAFESDMTLGDVTERVSPGLATGRDGIFVNSREECPSNLVEDDWVHPTISGKQLVDNDGPHCTDVIVCPYDEVGDLVAKDELGTFGEWAREHREELESRSCVKNGKDWYSWHDNPPMEDVVGRPKIIYPDLAQEPQFWIDEEGDVLPRHSVYYIIPKDGVDIHQLKTHLESSGALTWLESNCHRAANGYYRIQSSVITDLPVPEHLADTIQTEIV